MFARRFSKKKNIFTDTHTRTNVYYSMKWQQKDIDGPGSHTQYCIVLGTGRQLKWCGK